jgi:peptidoglycan/xylan/chitin deacetylase (PgdA/CDA1 family)
MRNKRAWIALCSIIFLLFAVASSLTGTRATAGRQYNPDELVDVPVLNYHKVDNIQHALALTPDEFDEQMGYLAENGYHTISPDQLVGYLKYGRPLPDKPVLITFDDGYLDNYTNAYPILKKYHFTATIFLVTSLVGADERFMTWDQVREMQKSGFTFGSHTVHHQALTKLTPEQVQEELLGSRDEMERRLGAKPRYFAYPTGAYNRQLAETVRLAGYRAAFTIRYGEVGLESDQYALERIALYKSGHSFRSFFYRLAAAPVLERMGLIRN